MKLQTLKEAKYASKRDITNLLRFFEEQPNEVMGHQTFYLREGLVCYFTGHEIHEIEKRNETYFAKIDDITNPRFREINDESIDGIGVFKLQALF